jgi:transcriptional regulator with XRE-family HTH domain
MAANTSLRAARQSLGFSQDDLAHRLRLEGIRDASKRQVQRWERGQVSMPWPYAARALERVFGVPIEQLGFTSRTAGTPMDDGRGGYDVRMPPLIPLPESTLTPPAGNYSGIWLSRYEFFSSERREMSVDLCHVLLLQRGNDLSVRSLPGSTPSTITMDLTVESNVITGTWRERTNPHGPYRGAVYHGAIQLLAEPTGRRMAGKWCGFGSRMETNTGPWELLFRDASTSKATLDRYSRQPEA